MFKSELTVLSRKRGKFPFSPLSPLSPFSTWPDIIPQGHCMAGHYKETKFLIKKECRNKISLDFKQFFCEGSRCFTNLILIKRFLSNCLLHRFVNNIHIFITKRGLNTYLFVKMCSWEIDRFLINLILMKVIFHHILLQPFVPDIHEGLTNVLSFGYVCQFTLNMRFLLISYKKSTVLLRPVRLCLCPFDTSPILISL